MNTCKYLLITAAMLAAMSSGLEIHAQSPQPTPNSARNSPTSDTRVIEPVGSRESGVLESKASNVSIPISKLSVPASIAACMAAAVELDKTRALVNALQAENGALIERLATEKQTTAILTELSETRRSETDALRNAIAAKNETIAAKDVVIASQDKLVEALKKKKPAPWRRIGDILIGAAAIAVLK